MKLSCRLIAVTIALIFTLLLSACKKADIQQLSLQEESYFSDFVCRNECVYFQCHLIVKNAGNPATVRITASSEEDAGTLLSDPKLEAWSGMYDPNTEDEAPTNRFTLSHGINALDVYFEGSWSGIENASKLDKLLPDDITFTIVE